MLKRPCCCNLVVLLDSNILQWARSLIVKYYNQTKVECDRQNHRQPKFKQPAGCTASCWHRRSPEDLHVAQTTRKLRYVKYMASSPWSWGNNNVNQTYVTLMSMVDVNQTYVLKFTRALTVRKQAFKFGTACPLIQAIYNLPIIYNPSGLTATYTCMASCKFCNFRLCLFISYGHLNQDPIAEIASTPFTQSWHSSTGLKAGEFVLILSIASNGFISFHISFSGLSVAARKSFGSFWHILSVHTEIWCSDGQAKLEIVSTGYHGRKTP